MSQMDGVIDVKDLFAELVRKCWIIALCTVLFAGGLGGYKYINDKQSAANVDEIENNMTEEELEATMDYVEAVQEFTNIEDYLENSIMMTANPYNLYKTQIQYVISGDINEDDITTIRTCYENYVLYGRLMSDIIEVDEEYAGKVLLDALTVDKESRIDSDTLKIVNVLVYAKDAKQTEELVTYVKEQIESYSDVVKKEIGNHELVLLNEATMSIVDFDLILVKNQYETNYALLETEVLSLGESLSVAQKSYANELLKETLDEEKLEELEIETDVETTNVFGVVKFTVLGGVVGFAMAVVLIVALYFFTDQIKSEKEIEHLYGINHFGNCPVYKGSAFDRFADKLFYKTKLYDIDDAKALIVADLVTKCKEDKINEIGIVGKVDELAHGALEDMRKMLDKEGIKMILMDDISEDRTKLPQYIVNVELVKKTNMQDVASTIESCKEKELTVYGYITFSK